MNVLGILGSPRIDGNSSTLAKKFLKTAEGLGAHTEMFHLNSLKYKGCQGCYACKGAEEFCVVDDDLHPVLDAMYDANIILLASPNYYGDVSGQMKSFIDRTFSHLHVDFINNDKKSRLPEGKHMVFIITQAAKEDVSKDILDRYYKLKHYLEFEAIHFLVGSELTYTNTASMRPDLLHEASGLARSLIR
ncbi:MAG: flavodoxin family protein [Desulfovibrionales bacterium]|nr:flavodoxin family protein [Desulfovibrionales bacterium]